MANSSWYLGFMKMMYMYFEMYLYFKEFKHKHGDTVYASRINGVQG